MDETAAVTLRERRRLATEAEVSAAALELFETRGVAATTIGDIARAAGISERTFFRYFASKEETVLDFQHWFDAPTRAWLAAGPDEHALLGQLEDVCTGVLRQLDGPHSAAADRLRRIRSLMKKETSLRAVSAMLDGEQSFALTERMVQAFDGRVSLLEARLAAEIVGMGLRAACENWSSLLDAGEPATLENSYRQVRQTISSLTAGSTAR
jgi:AcrR family transcriptional regulator